MSVQNIKVLVGLGSNQGDSRSIVLEAMRRLSQFSSGEVACSRLWRTSPVDCPPDSGDFINAAAAFSPRSTLTPEVLLAELGAAWLDYDGDHDLDLLLYGDEVRDSDDFILPHPRAVDRRFVLAPAAEVLPDAIWPGTGQTIGQLLAALHSEEQVDPLDVTPAEGAPESENL